MTVAVPSVFEVHWSLVPPGDAAGLVPPGRHLLAIWPAPVNHDACFEGAGFTLFGDNNDAWQRAAEGLLRRVIERASHWGAPQLLSVSLRDDPPWYRRTFRTGRVLPLADQALLPMQDDSLPPFHARFGADGAALRTGDGHFLLWIDLPDAETDPAAFVHGVAGNFPVFETRLRWERLLSNFTHADA